MTKPRLVKGLRYAGFRRDFGAVALEFLFIFPLIIGLLYGGAVYGLLFFHKWEMQEVVDGAAASVYRLDRRQYGDFGGEVISRSEAALDQFIVRLPDRIKSRITDKGCEETNANNVVLLECRLKVSGGKENSFFPRLTLGFLGNFPPQPDEFMVRAAVAF